MLSDVKLRQVENLARAGVKFRNIEAATGVSYSSVRRIARGKVKSNPTRRCPTCRARIVTRHCLYCRLQRSENT